MNVFPPRGLRSVKWRDVIDAVRKLSAAARNGNQDFGAAVDARGAALAILSLDGRFIATNASAAFLFGYTSDELLGRTLIEMADSDAKQDILDGLSSCAAGTLLSFHAALQGRDGRASAILIHQHPITNNAGSVSAILTIFEEPIHACPSARDGAPPPDQGTRPRRFAQLMIGQERERKRIASELHDGLGQALTLIKLTVEDALIRLHGGRIAEARELLDGAVVRICEAIGDVRQICGELHPLLLDRLGLVAALASLCRRVDERAQNSRVRFDCDVKDDEVPDNLKADIFRIAQESINNALRHGSASTIQVSLCRLETSVLLSIQDDGIGFDTLPVAADSAAPGLGLIGMQQRVESAGGSFVIQSSGTGGTLVSALWKA
jgi:two-component system, NarL family, sensor kinase